MSPRVRGLTFVDLLTRALVHPLDESGVLSLEDGADAVAADDVALADEVEVLLLAEDLGVLVEPGDVTAGAVAHLRHPTVQRKEQV